MHFNYYEIRSIMEFHQIRYFLTVAETLNFTRAAERCNVSQPALTRAIQKLEAELGGSLFRRERSNTHLTELGKTMREFLGRVDESSQEALSAARKVLGLKRAPLHVGIMCTIGPCRTIPFLSRFQTVHPGVDLTLHDLTPLNAVDEMLSGKLDCALLALPNLMHERFDSVLLYEEPVVAIFPPGHRFEKFDRIPMNEIAAERYLDRLNCEFRDIYFELLQERHIHVTVNYRSEREDWIQNMVLQEMGITLIPEYSIILDQLQYRPITDPDVVRRVEIVTVAGRNRSATVDAFIQEALAHSWH